MTDSHPAHASQTLAIASGKGGVGKTVVAITLAHAFARSGDRVLLFDGDLGMANIDVQLGIDPPRNLSAVVSGDVGLAEAASPALGGADNGGFDVIAGRSGSGALAGLSREAAARLASGVAAVSLSYDRVVMDLAAGADPALFRLAMAADEQLVVLTDEPTSLTDAYAFTKMLRLRDQSAAPHVAVNLVDSYAAGRAAYEGFAKTCQSFLGFRPALAGVIRRDPGVKAAIRRQQALLERGDGPAARDLEQLALTLSGGADRQVA